MKIKKYQKLNHDEWNNFLTSAKNLHFMFYREYMEYHSDRFVDHSLMIYTNDDKLIALLPSNENVDGGGGGQPVLQSHGGLTFGGFIVNNKMRTETMLNIFVALKEYLLQNGFKSLIYKCIPYIYHKYPCEEDRYALFINDAELIRRDVSTSIFLPKKYSYNENCRRNIKKALKNKIEVLESDQYEKFIDLQNEVLQEYHSAKAVHSGEELRSLAEKFPQSIKLYIAELNDEMLAGTVVFINDHIVHTQYMANSNHGRKLGALDFVIDHLINNVFSDKIYFDFGISNENEGRYLNQGLIRYKESYGARAVVHDFYRLNT